MRHQCDRVPLGPQPIEGLERLLLVGFSSMTSPCCFGRKSSKASRPRNALQEEGELLLDRVGVIGDLPVGPAEDRQP